MKRKLTSLLFVSLLALTSASVFAQSGDGDDFTPTTVPETGSTSMLALCAVAAFGGLSLYLRQNGKKHV